jgi:uncharacterized protein YegJ (DUF2314 family)
MRLIDRLATAFMLLLPVSALGNEQQQDDGVMRIDADDRAMNAAIKTARASFPYFLALAEKHPPHLTNFMVKVGVPFDGGNEYIWMIPFRRHNVDFIGTISNTPEELPDLKFGQQVIFPEDNIVDWAYRDNGVARGHFTTCVLVTRMKADERIRFQASQNLQCASR